MAARERECAGHRYFRPADDPSSSRVRVEGDVDVEVVTREYCDFWRFSDCSISPIRRVQVSDRFVWNRDFPKASKAHWMAFGFAIPDRHARELTTWVRPTRDRVSGMQSRTMAEADATWRRLIRSPRSSG